MVNYENVYKRVATHFQSNGIYHDREELHINQLNFLIRIKLSL